MASNEVSGAVVAKFLAEPALIALCPQMYAEELPETDAAGNMLLPPFALVEVPTEDVIENFESSASGTYQESATLQITIFAPTVALRDQIAAAFKLSYDWLPLPFASASIRSIAMNRTQTRRGREEYQDANGNRVFHCVLEYQAVVGK